MPLRRKVEQKVKDIEKILMSLKDNKKHVSKIRKKVNVAFKYF